jgi:hypothetical protein
MTLYELTCDVNEKLIKGVSFEEIEKQDVITQFLSNISSKDDIDIFRKKNKNKIEMYPFYYMPPYNDGKELRIISGYKPKTEILSANHYELEILRILALWANENDIVKEMI